MNNTPTWRNILTIFGIFAAIAVGGTTLLMAQHNAQPHQDAVSQTEFARSIDRFDDRLDRIEIKLDQLILRGK